MKYKQRKPSRTPKFKGDFVVTLSEESAKRLNLQPFRRVPLNVLQSTQLKGA